MGRVISNGTATSNANSASGVLQMAAGSGAINTNDLLVLNQRTSQAYAGQSTDHAAVNVVGGAVVAASAVGYSTANYFNWRKAAIVLPDGSILALGVNAAGTYGDGLKVSKLAAAGGTPLSVTLDTVTGQTTAAGIVQLTNGNFAITWGNAGGTLQYFAIIDSNLNVIVAKTSTGLIGGGNASYIPDILALSGGGFIIAGQLNNGGGISFIIYTNAGGVTKALTGVTSSPATGTGVYAKLAQLTNGNIVIAISAITAGKYLGFAIYDATGTPQVAYTAVNTTTTTLAQPPEISAIGNVFCLGWNDNTNANAYVFSNAAGNTAVQQGGTYSVANATPTGMQIRLLNDGTAFWFVYGMTATNQANVAYIPVTGTNFVTTATTAPFAGSGSSIPGDAAIDKGMLILANSGANSMTTFKINSASHQVTPADSFTNTSGHSVCQIIPTFDFSIIEVGQYEVAVQKYAPVVIVGTAQSSVAAGNAGTLLLANEGPGGFPINSMLGTSGKPFSHGGGNRGAMYSNSVALSGVGNLRNIN